MKAVTYIRVSGQSQAAADRDGIPRQRAKIAAYAKAHGIDIVDEFRDEGVSGCSEPQYRPGLQALIGRLLLNGVRIVLVENADRIGRDSEVAPAVRLALRKIEGLKVINVDRGLDILDEQSRALNTIDDLIADKAKRDLVARLAHARRIRRERGERCDGRKPFGTRDGEADTVKRIAALRKQSLRAIAALLDEEGRATRSGKPWSAEAVRGVLSRIDAETKAAKRVSRKAAKRLTSRVLAPSEKGR
jgi:DNA invertase Pin-like site-specific DNA recombinase